MKKLNLFLIFEVQRIEQHEAQSIIFIVTVLFQCSKCVNDYKIMTYPKFCKKDTFKYKMAIIPLNLTCACVIMNNYSILHTNSSSTMKTKNQNIIICTNENHLSFSDQYSTNHWIHTLSYKFLKNKEKT